MNSLECMLSDAQDQSDRYSEYESDQYSEYVPLVTCLDQGSPTFTENLNQNPPESFMGM